jgi:hypothetical protein
MKVMQILIVAAICAGCAKASPDFVQGTIRIATPVVRQSGKGGGIHDGGTLWIPILDARGRAFDIYIDYRIGTQSPGAIYVNNYPGLSNSVRILDVSDFKRKVGDFDERR